MKPLFEFEFHLYVVAINNCLLLGTPPLDRTPKVREDQMVYALKPTPGANVEDIHLRLSSVGKTKIREDPATQPSGRGVIKWVP